MVVKTEHYYRGTEEVGTGGYDITFKGNTAVDISPRVPNEMYSIYRRQYYLADKAPLKDRPDYVAPGRIDW